jgi:hypothetical protein
MARKTRSRRKSRRARRIRGSRRVRRIRGSRRVRTYYGGEDGLFGKITEAVGEFGKKVGEKVGETKEKLKQTNLFGSSEIPAQSTQSAQSAQDE